MRALLNSYVLKREPAQPHSGPVVARIHPLNPPLAVHMPEPEQFNVEIVLGLSTGNGLLQSKNLRLRLLLLILLLLLVLFLR